MSSDSEPASTSIENNDSEDDIQIEKTESSSDNDVIQKSHASSQSDNSLSKEESSDSAPQSQKIISKHSETITVEKTEIIVKQNSRQKIVSRRHRSTHQSDSPSGSREYDKPDSESASYYSESNHSYPNSTVNSDDESNESLAKPKSGRLKAQRSIKKKHFDFDMIDDHDIFHSTDDEPENFEHNVNTRSQVDKEVGLTMHQGKSKCCLLI